MNPLFTLSGVLLAAIALLIGALIPFQMGANINLGRGLGHPFWAIVVSLCVSLLTIFPLIMLMRIPAPILNNISKIPVWAWFGGIVGVTYITSALFLTPRIGATNFMICIVAGQIFASLIVDHFGLMGLPIIKINAGRIMGATLILVGVFLVQWFGKK